MGAIPKFGKWSGGATLNVPAANSVTSDKIFDGGVATADIAAKAVTAAKLGSDVAGAGLTGGDGSAVEIDLNNITAEVVAVASDKFAFMDATDDSTKLESFADLANLMADGTTITSASGVIGVKSNGIGIAQHANDDKHSIFFVSGELDFGESNAVTLDLGAIGSKATLIGGYWTLTEAVANGDATNTIKLGTATGGGSTVASNLTITLANTADGQSNSIGMMRAILPNGSTSVDMASTTHLWLDCADDVAGTRSAGKVSVLCWLQKSA